MRYEDGTLEFAALDALLLLAPAPTGGVVFHAATGLDAQVIAAVQAKVRRRVLCSFVRRGLLAGDDVADTRV